MISQVSDQKRNFHKNSAVEPGFSFCVKLCIENYLLVGLEAISIILPDIFQHKADSVTFVYTRNW